MSTNDITPSPGGPGGAGPGPGGVTAAARARDAVARLRELVAYRGIEGAALEAELSERCAAARAAQEAASTGATRRLDEQRGKLDRAAEQGRLELDARYDREAADERARHDRERGAAVTRLDAAVKKAEDGLRESKFLAEAVSDAGRLQPAQEVERVKGEAKAEIERLELLEAEARRIAGPRVKFPETRPAAVVEPSEGSGAAAAVIAARPGESDAPPLDRLIELRVDVERMVRSLGGWNLHRLFRYGLPIWVGALLVPAAVAAFVWGVTQKSMSDGVIAGVLLCGPVLVAFVLTFPLRSVALAQTARRAEPLAARLIRGRELAREAVAAAQAYRLRAEQEIRERREAEVAAQKAKYKQRVEKVEAERAETLEQLDEKHAAKVADITARRGVERGQFAAEISARRARVQADHDAARAAAAEALEAALAEAHRVRDERASALAARWREGIAGVTQEIAACRAAATASCPPWPEVLRGWQRPTERTPAVAFGALTVELAALEGGTPGGDLMRGVPASFEVPALLDFPGPASMLLLSAEAERDAALTTLRNTVLRLLSALPPGKVRLTMIDPVGLGQSFAGFMRLADHDEKLVTSRIWTELRHIEQRLTDLTEHMETVIQKYLRNEFASIEAYNEAAGEIAEPYRFLVIADFPQGFSDEAARRLSSIVESGRRCGVYTLIHAAPGAKLPETIKLSTLAASGMVLRVGEAGPAIDDEVFRGLPLRLEAPPADTEAADLLDRIGRAALTAGRVEVPFTRLAAPDDKVWTGDASDEVRVSLGRAGATKFQQIALGRGTSQHVLIAGKTGSGKSTLLHVLITNAGLWFSPREVELYLVDFKKGVEFKAYAQDRLPHARAIAVESDREFGLSVLQRLDEELKRRGDLFRAHGAQSLAAARRAAPAEHLPRVMLIIDEFQEFFTEDDKIAQDAALLLDRLVRQGRAFGMHVLLGSQTLSGAYTLARSTVGQMAVRIALQCSETDSYLILSEDNAAARLLSRPGEAIYNDANGMMEGNNPFQVAWLADEDRDAALDRITARAREAAWVPPAPQIVFEGNVPADLARNHLLWKAAGQTASGTSGPLLAWLGEPVAIKDPTAGVFRRQSGANVLLVGQQDEPSRAMIAAASVGLVAQLASRGGRLWLIDATPPDDPQAGYLRAAVEQVAAAAGVAVRCAGPRDAGEVLAELDAERARRDEAGGDGPPWVLVVYGVQRVRALRKKDDDFSFSFSAGEGDEGGGADPAKQFGELLRDGPPMGMHTLAWCDTYANLARTLDRAAIAEFEQRAVLQMSAADSSNLIDSPVAGRLGMNRGLLFNEELGTIEKFRPYDLPTAALLDRLAASARPAAGAAPLRDHA